jgi:hypothetical protein
MRLTSRFPRKTPFLLLAALVVAIAASIASPASAAADDKTYAIKLVRPPKVGQKYTFTAEGALTRHTTITANGQELGKTDDEYGIHLEGTIEVLTVNKDGEEGKVACTVAKCTRVSPEGEAELIPAGRIITATGGKEETTFTIDQGKLSDEAKEAIDLVLRMGEEDGYNDDRIYGTTKQQPVGGSWDMDAKASSDEAKDDEVIFDPKDVSGTMRVDKAETIDGVECLRVSGMTEIKRLEFKAPEGLKIDKGTLKAHYGGAYPVDVKASGPLRESMSVTQAATFKGKGDKGGPDAKTVVETKVQRAADVTRKYLPDEKKPDEKQSDEQKSDEKKSENKPQDEKKQEVKKDE